jgi:hypothetical protein
LGSHDFRWLFIAGAIWLCLGSPEAFSQQSGQAPAPKPAEELILKDSAICEFLKDNSPVNAGSVFSMSIGRVVCLTSFTPASRRSTVFHSWFHRGQLSNKQRLAITPSASAALSSIQLREADKGPWQVEISDSSGRILKVLRFSIVD